MSVQPAIRKLTLNLPQSLAVSTGRVLSKFTLYWVVVSQNPVSRDVGLRIVFLNEHRSEGRLSLP
jgi:hypothetical protein